MIKIKISYEKDEELEQIKKLFHDQHIKISKNNKGQFKKAYINLKDMNNF